MRCGQHSLWRIGAARCLDAVSLRVVGFILDSVIVPSSLQVRVRSYGCASSSSSWRLALRCFQSPLVPPGAEEKWQRLPILLRRSSGAAPGHNRWGVGERRLPAKSHGRNMECLLAGALLPRKVQAGASLCRGLRLIRGDHSGHRSKPQGGVIQAGIWCKSRDPLAKCGHTAGRTSGTVGMLGPVS